MTQAVRNRWVLALVAFSALIVLGAVSELIGQPAAPRRIAGGNFEASGVVSVPGSDGVLFVDDAQTQKIFWMEFSGTGAQKDPAVGVALPGADVVDFEGMTTDGEYFYAVGSQSKNVGFDGDGLVRFTFDPATRTAGHIESVRALKRFLSQNVAELKGVEHQVGDTALNIEGLAWDSAHNRLLLGLRAPVAGGDALVVPLTLRDPGRPFAIENLAVEGTRAIRVPTGGAGLRSLEFDPSRNRFLLITGAAHNAESRDFRLFEWDGTEGAALQEVRSYRRKLKPEGITRARIAGRDATVIVFDSSAYEVIW